MYDLCMYIDDYYTSFLHVYSDRKKINKYMYIYLFNHQICLPPAHAGAQFQFSENDYTTTEGVNPAVEVVVQQIYTTLADIHLKLTPLTYARYTQRASQPGSTLPPLDELHRSRPDPAECKLA